MTKVIDFDAARAKRAEDMAKAEEFIATSKLPPEVELRLNEENEKVLLLVQHLNDSMDAYAANLPDAGSILIPVEALARQMAGLLTGLDQRLRPDIVQEQQEFRMELGDLLADYIEGFCNERYQRDGKPTFQHDMYLAVLSTLLTMIFDHRISAIITQVSKGEASGEERKAQDVQQEGETRDE